MGDRGLTRRIDEQARPITRAALDALDRDDPLAPLRAAFILPEGKIYLDGNSLGALPRATAGRLAAVVAEEWGRGLIGSWDSAGWIDLPRVVGDKIARLIGAAPGTVIVADSTSVNLFKLLSVALRLRPDRHVILSYGGNFPTDLYIAEGLVALLGGRYTLRVVEPGGIADALGPDVAVTLLTHIDYRTGAMHDMTGVTAAVQDAGSLMLWDLAHSAGAVPLEMARSGADFAVGCGYKFLNGGPGAPAFLYVAPGLQDAARYPITGWLGHADPFAFDRSYRPANGIARAAIGTPSILALAALEIGVDLALQAPMPAVRAKSLRQAAILRRLVAELRPELGCVTPEAEASQGSQLSFRHDEAGAVMQALLARGVIGDFRPPDILRFGITPLYLTYGALWDAAHHLAEVLAA